MESFGHKIFISSQPVPLMGTGVMYPRVRDFLLLLNIEYSEVRLETKLIKQLHTRLIWDIYFNLLKDLVHSNKLRRQTK